MIVIIVAILAILLWLAVFVMTAHCVSMWRELRRMKREMRSK